MKKIVLLIVVVGLIVCCSNSGVSSEEKTLICTGVIENMGVESQSIVTIIADSNDEAKKMISEVTYSEYADFSDEEKAEYDTEMSNILEQLSSQEEGIESSYDNGVLSLTYDYAKVNEELAATFPKTLEESKDRLVQQGFTCK